MLSPKCEIKNKKLDLPNKNTLIPTNFDILPKDENKSAKPYLLKSWPNVADLWYKQDDKWNKPKSIIKMILYTPDCMVGLNQESYVFSKVWDSMVDEYMREYLYMAQEAGLAFSISVDKG